MNLPEISLAPETLFSVGPIDVSSPMLATLLCSFALMAFGIILGRKATLVPGRIQILVEMPLMFFLDTLEKSLHSKKTARRLLPLILTVFFLLFLFNQFSLIPLVSSMTYGEAGLFRIPTAHYSLTIALAILTLGTINIIAFVISPVRFLRQFFKFHLFFKMKSIKDLPMTMIDFFLGLMDIISELSKFISLSTRLFGNFFAGEVILLVVSGLLFVTQFVVPIPFIVLGIMVGFVQAFVFAMLVSLFSSTTLNNVAPNNGDSH